MNVDDIKSVAVIGAGTIGQSTAAEFALAGYDVNLNSRSEDCPGRVKCSTPSGRSMCRS